MRKKMMMGMLIVLLGGSLLGCGQGENPDTTDPQGTLTPEATNTPEVTQAIFQPVKKEEETKLTGLREQLEKVEGLEAEKWNALNGMSEHGGSHMFCVDGETGVVYYVNYNKDFYIYRIKDGEVKLAVELPAKELYCKDGAVYFMIDTYEKYQLKEVADGDIYRYTSTTGVVELVYAAGAIENSSEHTMRLDDSGIHFSYTITETREENGSKRTARISHGRFLKFGSHEPVAESAFGTNDGWKNYAIGPVYTMESPVAPVFSLIDRTDLKEISLEIERPCHYCVIGDTLYYLPGSNNTKVLAKELNTGETKEYDFWNAVKIQRSLNYNEEISDEEFEKYVNDGKRLLTNFIIIGDFLYVTSGMNLYQMNLKTGKVCAYQAFDELRGVFGTLYTDGTNLYAMFATSSQSPKSLAKVYVDRVGVNEVGMATVEVEYVKETK